MNKYQERYIKQDLIGRGVNSFVFKGYDKINKTIVAIKVKYKIQNEEKKYLQGEYNLYQKINNEYSIKIFDIYENEEAYYIIMEYIELNLKTFLLEQKMKNKIIEKTFIMNILTQLNIFLFKLLENNIINRIIKIENIFLIKDSQKHNNYKIKINIFGLYKNYYNNINFKEIIYYPPEMGKNNFKNDYIWNIGIIIYKIYFYNECPFGDNIKDIYFNRINFHILKYPEDEEIKGILSNIFVNLQKRINFNKYLYNYFKNESSLNFIKNKINSILEDNSENEKDIKIKEFVDNLTEKKKKSEELHKQIVNSLNNCDFNVNISASHSNFKNEINIKNENTTKHMHISSFDDYENNEFDFKIINKRYSKKPSEPFIGIGKNSIIFKAYDFNINKLVAIKAIFKLKNKYFLESFSVQLYKNEIEFFDIFKKLNIIKLLDNFENSKFYFFVFELYDTNLKDLIKSKFPNGLSIELFFEIANIINSILKNVIKNNYIFKDIKLENILVKYLNYEKTKFDFKLCDFNEVSNFKYFEKYKIKDYFEFYSPEILENSFLNIKSSLWSLGILYYQMLFNEFPFDLKKENFFKSLFIDKKLILKKTQDKHINIILNKLLEINVDKRCDWDEYFNLFENFKNEIEKKDSQKNENNLINDEINNSKNENNLINYKSNNKKNENNLIDYESNNTKNLINYESNKTKNEIEYNSNFTKNENEDKNFDLNINNLDLQQKIYNNSFSVYNLNIKKKFKNPTKKLINKLDLNPVDNFIIFTTLKNENFIIISLSNKLYYYNFNDNLKKNVIPIKNYNKKKILCLNYYFSKNIDYLITSSIDNLIIIYDIQNNFNKVNIIENIGINCDENNDYLLFSFTQFELNNNNYLLTTCFNDNFIKLLDFNGDNKQIFFNYNNVKKIDIYYCNQNYIFYVIILGQNNVFSINFDKKENKTIFSKNNNNMIINNFEVFDNDNKIVLIESYECGNVLIYDFILGNLLKKINVCEKINDFIIINNDYLFIAADDSLLYQININNEEVINFPLKNSIIKINKFIKSKSDTNNEDIEYIIGLNDKKQLLLWESINLEKYNQMKKINNK